jgi:hypothetical protein
MSEIKAADPSQVEALQALTEYSPRFLNSLKAVHDELVIERKPDTDEFLDAIIKGMNWEIEVYNGTRELFEGNGALDKDKANQAFVDFSAAFKRHDDDEMGRLLREMIIPFFTALEGAAISIVTDNR